MEGMFSFAYAFNRALNFWNTSSVTSMYGMFNKARAFNRPIDNWDLGNVEDMRFMMDDAESFNQCLSTWAYTVPDNVNTAFLFRDTACPEQSNPVPGIGPWCQGVDTCTTPPCEDVVGTFSISETTSCDELAGLSLETIKDLCSLPWGIAESCPTLCPGRKTCKCTDFSVSFSGTSCAEIAEKSDKKIEKKCTKDSIFEYCPSI